MTQPSVSVVIPCYNREATIQASVQSVLDQSFKDIEVIAVDDASNDATVAALRSITDPRLRIIECRKNAGAAETRNVGARLAKANWIAFQDSDDIWHPEKLEKQVALLDGSSAVACYCAMTVFKDGEVFGQVPHPEQHPTSGQIADALLASSFISTQTVVIRKDIYKAVHGMDPAFRALDDWDLMLRVARQGRIEFLRRPMVDQHMSGNSITNDHAGRLRAQIQFVEKHREMLAAKPKIMALHRHRIAGALRQQGHPVQAVSHALEAVRLAPSNLRHILQVLRCLAGCLTIKARSA